MSNSLHLNWSGPFTFWPFSNLPCVFDDPAGRSPGLYLWTVKHNDGYLINYVGEASKQSIHDRLAQGVRWTLSGQDKWADQLQFEKGIRNVEPPIPLTQFLTEHEGRSQRIIGNLKSIRVFIAPYVGDAYTTRQIEGVLLRTLLSQPEGIRGFLANTRPEAAPPELSLSCSFPCKIHGLESLANSDEALN